MKNEWDLTQEQLEIISALFWNKYAGKGLSPSEVMELHKSEYWESITRAADIKLVEWLDGKCTEHWKISCLPVYRFECADCWAELKKELGVK